VGLFRRRRAPPLAAPAPAAADPAAASEPPGTLDARNREVGRMLAYHERTKHTYATVYRGGWELDWDNQPNPFRRYAGAPRVELPPGPRLPAGRLPLRATGEVLRGLAAPPAPDDAAWDDGPAQLSALLWHALAVSAWKQVPGTGTRWSLRVNPSSGNLHPTEAHLLALGCPGLPDGAYHHDARQHALERRREGPAAQALAAACGLPAGGRGVLLVLTSIFWREAWKYRDRAYRYCLLDAGHAAASVAGAARALGLPAEVRLHFPDRAVQDVLGLRDGGEQPLALVDLRTGCRAPEPQRTAELLAALSTPAGTPNRLSAEVLEWPLIDGMHASTLVEGGACPLAEPPADALSDTPRGDAPSDTPREPLPLPDPGPAREAFARAARRRRSAIDFEPSARIALADFAGLLREACVLPRTDALGSLFGDAPRRLVEVYVYAHRVEGLPPGCFRYLPESHALLPVRAGDVQAVAAGLSLGQELAGHALAAFSLVADLARGGAAFGNRAYRHAHVEAGMLGQGLYLAATARGWDATGIGAFFDDDVHRWLGLRGHARQVVYHHAIGRAAPDPRLVEADAELDQRDPP
jgi:SagB-type dehydrogenase family enzyme